MKWSYAIFLLVLLMTAPLSAQQEAVSEFDLYGCWVLEVEDMRQRPEILQFRPCEKVEANKKRRGSKLVFQAYSKCDFNYQSPLCPPLITVRGSWEYNAMDRIITIYYPEDYHKIFWTRVKEIETGFSDIVVPKKWQHSRYELVQLEKGMLSLRRLKTTNNLERSPEGKGAE